jgi:AAHS family 4-hydroxybenzoate transporter-like MFS transporter
VPIDVGRTIDSGRWTRYQKWLVLLTALAIIFDGFDNQLLGLALPALMQDWGLPRNAFASVVSIGYLGMMLGGAGAGMVGDRLGRRVALLGSVAAFGIATTAIAVTDSLASLGALRLVAGLGLGGAIPNGAALAAEYVPLGKRPIAVTLTIVCVPLGGVLAGLFAVPALPAVGWRGLFAIGGAVPVLTALILIRLLPESPRYLASRPERWPELVQLLRRMELRVDSDATFTTIDPGSAHAATPFTSLFARELRRDTFALWAAFLSCLLAVYLGFSWLPSLLTGAGLSPAIASTGLTLFNLGGVAGAIAGGLLIARFGSKPTMVTMAAGAVVGATVMGGMPLGRDLSPIPFLVMLAITGGLINAVQTTMYALAAHVYPTMIRATGVGTASAVGRTGAILSGFVGAWALERGAAASFFVVMAASLMVTLLSVAVITRHVRRR